MLMHVTDETRTRRALGNVFAPRVRFAPVYGDAPATPLIPRALWPRVIAPLYPRSSAHPFLPWVHDQGHVGQCNAEAVTAALEFQRDAQGLPYVQLSAADLYGRINNGVDQGSYLEDALAEVVGVGVGTAKTCGLLWDASFRAATNQERGRYRVTEYYLCPTFSHCMSAVLSGFALVSGVEWWGDYDPDEEGWMPTRGRGRSGGHALMGYKPAMLDGRYGIWHQNSFGEQWGQSGRCVLPEAAFTGAIGGWWAVRQVVTEEGDLPALVA